MKLGVFDHLDDSGRPLSVHYEERLKLAERYDAAGFHAYHLAEHHATPLGTAPSPNIFLAAMSQRTRRLRFGPMVYCLPLYHPLRLFEEICMLDQLSGGRLEFGVGRGISPIEAGYFDVAADEARDIYVECLDLIRLALTSDELNFRGHRYRIDAMPVVLKAVQQPHPPLWYGVVDAEGAARAGGNGMNIITNQRNDQVRAIAAAHRAKRLSLDDDLLIGMSRHIVVADDSDAALDIARRAYRPWRHSFMVLWQRYAMMPPNVRLPAEIDGLIEAGLAIVGTAEEVARRIAAQVEETGVNYFVCRFAFGDLTFDEAARSLDLFVERAMPQL